MEWFESSMWNKKLHEEKSYFIVEMSFKERAMFFFSFSFFFFFFYGSTSDVGHFLPDLVYHSYTLIFMKFKNEQLNKRHFLQ